MITNGRGGSVKRYEKMSKEEIIDSLCMFEDTCFACPCSKDESKCKDDCGKNWKEWLNEEIELIPRALTFKTAEEAQIEFEKICNNVCIACTYAYHDNSCRFEWLYELIEKPIKKFESKIDLEDEA